MCDNWNEATDLALNSEVTSMPNGDRSVSWEGKDGCTEASTCGWTPGFWPEQWVFDGDVFTKTGVVRDDGNDVLHASYQAPDGRTVCVFND